MGDARSGEDRLPWLDAPRPAKSRAAARRARRPLLVLLALFLASAIAVMAYLSGWSRSRESMPPTPRGIALAPAPIVPRPVPVLPTPVVPSVPVVATPALPVIARVSARAGKARATWAAAKRVASARNSVRRRVAARVARDARIERNTRSARAVARRYRWPASSAAGPSGRVVQLGAYRTGRQTTAAWLRLRRAYPHLRTLPRKVTVAAPRAGRPRYYRLRIGTRSTGEARALCDTLHRIGRGCIIA